jgi:ABC-type dipeptide/oligopeptide/nickel transport system permease subunit
VLFDPRARARFAKNRAALIGGAIVLTLVAFALLGPLFASHGPLESDFARGLTPSDTPAPPGGTFPFGADRLFRDVFVRLAYGARLSLLIAIASTVLASTIGAAVGIVAGYYEGSHGVRVPWLVLTGAVFGVGLVIFGHPWWGLGAFATTIGLQVGGSYGGIELLRRGPSLNVDTALMRLVDVGLSFPFLLLVMAIGGALDRTTVVTILITLGLTGWLGTARVLRAKTMQVRSFDYVLASRALGQSTPAILMRHVLPNVAGPLIVIATVSVAQMIVAESVLSYLGVGISPPTPTWGRMLFEGQDYYRAAPWLLVAPAAAILLAVFGFNMLGEGLRDALDPNED